MKRVSVVHRLDVLNIGGIQEMVFNLYKFSRHEHSWWVMAGGGSFEEEMRGAGMKIHIGETPPRIDVLVGHTVGGWSYNETFTEMRARGAATIECIHSNAFSQTAPELTDAFVALSQIAAGLNSNHRRVEVIYAPFDVMSFRPRETCPSPPKNPIIGRLSRLAPEKRPLDFVRIARAMPEHTFVIAGGGPLLREVIDSAPPNLKVLGWVRDFQSFYSGLDLFVFPTSDECCCVSVAMAQAAGVPVICQDIAALRETTRGNAVFCNDIYEFVGTIRAALSAPGWNMIRKIAEDGRASVEANFALERTVSAWDRLVDSLVSDGGRDV